jgi:hypothetical protein
MSFQGPGTGISGTSNQFAVGYAQSAGYTQGNIGGNAPNATYATYAGSAGNINGYAPTAGYANNLAVQGIGGSTWAWAGQPGIPNHYWGSNQGGYHAVWQANQGYVGYAGSAGNINGYAPSAGYANQASNINITSATQGQFGWQGQNTTPSWLWGSNQGNIETVFAPGNLSVGYAGYAGSAGNINGYAPSAGYAGYAGYANQCYIASQAYVAQYVNQAGGFPRAGRNGAYGGQWGQGVAGYNQQGTYAFSDYYVQYGNYYSFYGYYWGNWNVTAGQFQGNSRLGMFGVNASVNFVIIG